MSEVTNLRCLPNNVDTNTTMKLEANVRGGAGIVEFVIPSDNNVVFKDSNSKKITASFGEGDREVSVLVRLSGTPTLFQMKASTTDKPQTSARDSAQLI